jgi:hypothetical protein
MNLGYICVLIVVNEIAIWKECSLVIQQNLSNSKGVVEDN